MKYHVNPDSGAVRVCRAKVRCRFGGESGKENHFTSKAAADKAAESHMANKHQMPALKKQGSSTNVDKQFAKTAANITRGLKSAGLLTDKDSLPEVANEKEMIAKWFNGDRAKYELIARIARSEELNAGTKKSVGKFINDSMTVTMLDNMDFETKDPQSTQSDVDLIEDMDEQVNLADLKSGKLIAFK